MTFEQLLLAAVEQRLLRPLDVQFALMVAQEAHPAVKLTAAILSRDAGEGHVCLPLSRLAIDASMPAALQSCFALLGDSVDWQTVLFFLGLFLTVSGLEQTGVLEAMANGIAGITGGNLSLMIVILIWLSAVASAFVDNIPFAATMVPVISSLSATMGVDLNTLAWTLSMGTDIGGSATPIGASANVAGTAIAAREGHPISWGRYCKYSAPAAVIVVAISMAVILLRY